MGKSDCFSAAGPSEVVTGVPASSFAIGTERTETISMEGAGIGGVEDSGDGSDVAADGCEV
jgi:hypothetical protein